MEVGSVANFISVNMSMNGTIGFNNKTYTQWLKGRGGRRLSKFRECENTV